MKKGLLTVTMVCLLAACDVNISQADSTFGTQNFVSAVSIIELYKLRNGDYPDTLDDLEFLGQWDSLWLSAVRYEKAGDGYHLYLERGWVNQPELSFPKKFKQGLGIRDTNITWR